MVKKKHHKVSNTFFKKIRIILISISLGCSFYFLCRGIDLPYVGYNSWNFNIYSLIAHNYNQFGFFTTNFAPIISVGKSLPTNPELYLHHPLLTSILQALFFRLLGENFFVGKLLFVISTFLSTIILSLIAKELWGKMVGIIALVNASFLPATILFGRMIGQEPLELLFILSALYYLVKYLQTKSVIFFCFSLLSVILGVLTDWPMIYFVACVGIWLYIKNERKVFFILFFSAVFVGLLQLTYIYVLQHNFSDLLLAINTRSLGNLTHLSYWPLRWITTIFIRFIFYFNPLIIFSSGILFISPQLKKHIQSDHRYLLFSLAVFGCLHVVLYPDGSFGHPYWICYLLPFVVFSSSIVMNQLVTNKKIIPLIFICLFSVFYIYKVDQWKIKEIQGNVWRYELAKQITSDIPKYSMVGLSPNVPIDYDLLRYKFLLMSYAITPHEIQTLKNMNYYICDSTCDTTFLSNYKKITIHSGWGDYVVYNVTQRSKTSSQVKTVSKKVYSITPTPGSFRFPRDIYLVIQRIVGFPQL